MTALPAPTPPKAGLPPASAVIFDLDGTLIDSRADIAAACNHALVTHGRDALSVARVRTFVGDGARMLLARAFVLPPDSPELEAPLEAFHRYYLAHPVVYTTLLPGARETLDACKIHRKKTILATNKPRRTTLRVLAELGISSDFDAVRGGDGPLKPDPHVILSALEEVQVPPSAAWMVGDAPQDIEAARAARCALAIGILDGFAAPERLRASRPDLILSSLLELPPLLADGAAIKARA